MPVIFGVSVSLAPHPQTPVEIVDIVVASSSNDYSHIHVYIRRLDEPAMQLLYLRSNSYAGAACVCH